MRLHDELREHIDAGLVGARNYTGWAALGYLGICTEACFTQAILRTTLELAMASCALQGAHECLTGPEHATPTE